MKTILLFSLLLGAITSSAQASVYSDRLPGRRQAVDVPALESNPFVNSILEVEKVTKKQDEVSLTKIFEDQLAKAAVTGMFWASDAAKRSILINGHIVRIGDPFPVELWPNGGAFIVKGIDVNKVSFAVPGVGDERIVKTFELRIGRPKPMAKRAPTP
jgi:hypothetical protein